MSHVWLKGEEREFLPTGFHADDEQCSAADALKALAVGQGWSFSDGTDERGMRMVEVWRD